MNCIKWRWVGIVVRLLGGLLMIIGACNIESNLVLLIPLGLLIVGIAFRISFSKWRCPSCDRHISENSSLFTTHCPYCGESLD